MKFKPYWFLWLRFDDFDSSIQAAEIEEVIVIAEKRSEFTRRLRGNGNHQLRLDVKNITDFVARLGSSGKTVAKNEGYKTVISFEELATKQVKLSPRLP